MTKPVKQVHLAAHFPGVNNTTVWSDPRSGSHIEFSSFAHLARTAERAKFDFLFLAEGLRLREQNGEIYDLDVVGRPDTFTVLAALAAVTDRLGLAGTINSTFNEPYEVARQFASLDHLSGGRAAWNVVTSWDAFTGENFRRGGFLPQHARYERARTFLQATWDLFDSWRGDEIIADQASGQFLTEAKAGAFEHHDVHFDISGQFNVPRSPQGRPVIFQAGDSEEGREFAASSADAIFSRPGTLAEGQAFYADVKGRLPKYGRTPDQLLILPAATFVLGDTGADAAELARQVRLQQVSGQTAIKFLEQLWNRDLSGYDPDGPLPDIDPDPGENTIARGRASVRMYRDPLATAAQWRAKAAEQRLSIRELIIEVTGRQTFAGSPATVAEAIDTLVQADASDGFILVPHITPGGLDEFADTVVPLLQERGVFRSGYEGPTLREHLGLAPLKEETSPPSRLPCSISSRSAQAPPPPRRCGTASTWPRPRNASATPDTGSPSTISIPASPGPPQPSSWL
jgi:FMN-dependent oxidoreductase (nitrilotriacetate monooxygenase family)